MTLFSTLVATGLGDPAFGLSDARLPFFFGEAAVAAIREHLQLTWTFETFAPGLCGGAGCLPIRLA